MNLNKTLYAKEGKLDLFKAAHLSKGRKKDKKRGRNSVKLTQVLSCPQKTQRIMTKIVCLDATAQTLLFFYHFSMMAEANTP